MAFCTKCGKEIEEGAKFCPSCGAAVSSNEDNYQNFSKVVVDEKISPKSKIAAGLLQIFLGSFGIGRFYTGHIGLAVAQLMLIGILFTNYININNHNKIGSNLK